MTYPCGKCGKTTPNLKECFTCTNFSRADFIDQVLNAVLTDDTLLEGDTFSNFLQQRPIPKFVENRTFGERAADKIAEFCGSWPFLGWFFAIMFAWMGINGISAIHPFDPYPYTFLNLILSCLAGVQAPVIMMAQNRAAAKDRAKAEMDYKIGVKTDLMLQYLDWKLDAVLSAIRQDIADIEEEERKQAVELAGMNK